MYRTARAGLRLTRGQRRRLVGLLVSAGDVWACVLELNAWRRARGDVPLVLYQALCRELAAAGPGCFGELDSTGARSVLRRYSGAWFATAARRKNGDASARFPRRRRRMMPVRWYHGTFILEGRRLRVPVARGCSPLWLRLDRDLPYAAGQVRSVTLLYDTGRLWCDVTAEVPVAAYPAGEQPDPARVAGVDLGIIPPYAAAGPDGRRCLCPAGRSAPSITCTLKTPRRGGGPSPAARRDRGSAGRGGGGSTGGASGPWSARHRRRVRQAQHEGAAAVVGWAVARRIGTLAVGDPRGVLGIAAGRRHHQRTRDWRIGHLITVLRDKAELAGITVLLADERGTSSTCPACAARVPKPPGRGVLLPALRAVRAPRPARGRQHRRARPRRQHASHHRGRRHAPPHRNPPAWCVPGAT